MMIRIVTDTLSDLPQEIVDAYHITLIPLYIHFGQETYRDRFDLSGDEFFRRLASAPSLPTTSTLSLGDFQRVYQDILANDPKATILSIHVASTFSGTVSVARQAADMLAGADIHIFDTLSATLSEGLMVLEAASMALKNASLDAILSRLAAMRDGMQLLLTPATLDYLAKGGRIGHAAHLIGTLLDIKPVLRVKDGVVEPCERYRTHKRAVAAIRDLVIKDARGKLGLYLAVMHAQNEEAFRWLSDELQAALKPEVFLSGGIAATIGTHVGPGAVGVCWWAPA